MDQYFNAPWIKITTQPRDQQLNEGGQLMLICKAEGHPSPLSFQWYCNGQKLEDQNANILMIMSVTTQVCGKYKCQVSNEHMEVWSDEIMVLIGSMPSDKVALLIGNQSYRYDNKLYASINDVLELSNNLQKIGFKTFVFVDLTYNLMQRVLEWFYTLLTKNAYCFVYFAGHGFENGECYIVPIDAPPQYQSQHCFKINYILQGLQQYELSLTLFCIDTCRTLNKNETHGLVNNSERRFKNVVISHATTEHGKAFEIDGENLSVYAKYLSKYITEDKFVLSTLSLVHAAIDSDVHLNGRQIAEMRSTLCEQRKLTDPTMPTSTCVTKSTDYFNIWKLAKKKQNKSYILKFDIGCAVYLCISLPAYNILKIRAKLDNSCTKDFALAMHLTSNTKPVCLTIHQNTIFVNCLHYAKNETISVCIRVLQKHSSGALFFEDFHFSYEVPIPMFCTI